ncbi:MAG TPA: hypothetical protein DCP63_15070 [Bacteroidetes bacterium]|nr:hypothetical protein [Bacteroidota bacterium]
MTETTKILIVEDNKINQRLLQKMLLNLGYGSEVAGNGLEAIAALERSHFDLVFMDISMPVMDGLEATRQILERWKEHERPTIIAVTANTTDEDKEKCSQAGMNDFISKPLRFDDLQRALERWTSRQSPPQQTAQETSDTAPESPLNDVIERLRLLAQETDPEFVLDLIDTSMPYLQKSCDSLLHAAEQRDVHKIQYAAHSLKGSSLNVGAKTFGELCGKIEQQAKAGNIQAFASLKEHFQTEFAEMIGALTSARDKLAAHRAI